MAENAVRGGCYWQERLTQVVERDRFLLKEGKFTDVVFLVGEEAREFHCHRLYLAKTSPAFESMLYGALASPLGEPIRIPDASPDGFQALLTYIYEGKVDLKSFSAASGLLQLSKKYLLPRELQQQCRAQCWTFVRPSVVWQAIQFASENQEDVILDTAWQIVFRYTALYLKMSDFCELPESIILHVIQQERQNCSELELYQACVRWGQAEIARRGLPESAQGLRTALAALLPHIRFLAMDNEGLATALTPPTPVSEKQALCLFMLKNSNNTSPQAASVSLTEFNLTTEPRTICEKMPTFQVEGCPPDLLYFPTSGSVRTAFDIFTKDVLNFPINANHETHLVGLILPTQVKKGAAVDEEYEEELTVHVFNLNLKDSLVCTTKFKGFVSYNTYIMVCHDTPPCCLSMNAPSATIVLLHKSGTYPTVMKETHKLFDESVMQPTHVSRFSDIGYDKLICKPSSNFAVYYVTGTND